jgi:hypothetical protein
MHACMYSTNIWASILLIASSRDIYDYVCMYECMYQCVYAFLYIFISCKPAYCSSDLYWIILPHERCLTPCIARYIHTVLTVSYHALYTCIHVRTYIHTISHRAFCITHTHTQAYIHTISHHALYMAYTYIHTVSHRALYIVLGEIIAIVALLSSREIAPPTGEPATSLSGGWLVGGPSACNAAMSKSASSSSQPTPMASVMQVSVATSTYTLCVASTASPANKFVTLYIGLTLWSCAYSLQAVIWDQGFHCVCLQYFLSYYSVCIQYISTLCAFIARHHLRQNPRIWPLYSQWFSGDLSRRTLPPPAEPLEAVLTARNLVDAAAPRVYDLRAWWLCLVAHDPFLWSCQIAIEMHLVMPVAWLCMYVCMYVGIYIYIYITHIHTSLFFVAARLPWECYRA